MCRCFANADPTRLAVSFTKDERGRRARTGRVEVNQSVGTALVVQTKLNIQYLDGTNEHGAEKGTDTANRRRSETRATYTDGRIVGAFPHANDLGKAVGRRLVVDVQLVAAVQRGGRRRRHASLKNKSRVCG